MNIYEINSDINEILKETDENGEITEDNLKKLSNLSIQRVDKLLNLGCWIKNLNSDSDGIGNEIKRLQERKKSIDNNINRLKDWATANMKEKEKIEDARIRISIRKSERCVLNLGITTADLPSCYQTIKITPNLVELKKLCKGGSDNEFAKIEGNLNLQIK